jgi:uncharacterized protein YjbI with pentapeptide repeats
MKNYAIRSLYRKEALFAGTFPDFQSCLQAAIDDRIPLHYADLRGMNLLNMEMDGADLRHASFSGSNLSGVNLSEALLDGTNFNGATLFGAVLCESRMIGASFDDAFFGGTDISHADCSDITISTLSAFDLHFENAASIKGARYINPCGTICPISRPPVVVRGLARPVIFMDRHIKIGHEVFETLDVHHPGFGIIQPLALRTMMEKLACMRDAAYKRNAAKAMG